MESDQTSRKIKITEQVYRTIGDIDLKMRIFQPSDCKSKDKRACIVFFFGGGWVGGSIDHFKLQSEYLASKGMVAITPEYRIKSKHGTTPFDCVEDGKAAIAWIRLHHNKMGIDPNRIVAAGGSAGGHVAACTAILNEATYDSSGIDSKPNALILFNPVIDTSEKGYGYDKLGSRYKELSPLHNVKTGIPPTIIFHGTGDTTVPFEGVVEFYRRMKKFGNDCTLISYEGKEHGFFNYGKSRDNIDYFDTLKHTEKFLQKKRLFVKED